MAPKLNSKIEPKEARPRPKILSMFGDGSVILISRIAGRGDGGFWMKHLRFQIAFMVVLGLTTLFAFQNCEQAHLVLTNELASAKSNGEICAIAPSAYENYTKVLFVIDKSGSNATTDTNQYRVNTINTFYQKHQANKYVQWGVVVFRDSNSEAYINNGSNQQPIFSGDLTVVSEAIARIGTAADGGGTPYRSALTMARAAVTYDIAVNPTQTANYVIVLLSDGQPTDYGTPIDENAIDGDVQTLKTAGRVSLSTVYYGPVDPASSGRLSRMAQVGGGKFLDTNIDGRIPIDSLIGFATAEPWIIKSFVVTNLNAATCDDGSVDVDSDADGLCDKDELRYNMELRDKLMAPGSVFNGRSFDPYNRNSFSPYLNDSLFYKHAVFGEAIPINCNDGADPDHDLMNNCEEQYLQATTPVGPTQKWTEAMGNDGDPFNFDSDGDGFLDGFEFSMTRNKSSANDRNNVAQMFLGLRLDAIFQQHLNWRNPMSSQAYDGQFRFSRVNSNGQNCYTYRQTVLPLYRSTGVAASQVSGNVDLAHGPNENVVMVYFIQTPERDPNGPGELRYNFQRLSAPFNELYLNLNVDQYRSYRVGSQARVKP